jgi:hypothetical protein
MAGQQFRHKLTRARSIEQWAGQYQGVIVDVLRLNLHHSADLNHHAIYRPHQSLPPGRRTGDGTFTSATTFVAIVSVLGADTTARTDRF